ncbi:MAG: DUF1858 domain-containing protein [Anaerovoracaceae bacterium]
MKITETMTVSQILDIDEKLEKVFEDNYLGCAGCQGAMRETLSEAAEGHGVNLEKLLADLNAALESE